MKKLFLLGALVCGIFAAQNLSAQPYEAEGCGTPTGECYCMYVTYQPCYYTTKRCVEEQIPCKRRCCRWVPKYCEVQRCRYVPEYYTETVCTQEREYYDVDYYKTCKRTVCEPCCKYVPRYYWKHVCNENGAGCGPCAGGATVAPVGSSFGTYNNYGNGSFYGAGAGVSIDTPVAGASASVGF